MHPRLAQQIDDVLRALFRGAPVMATASGVHDHDDELADFDPAAIAFRHREQAALRQALLRLREEIPDLAREDALDLQVLADHLEVERRLAEEFRPAFRDPAVYLDEILYGAYFLVLREFAPLPERARSLTRRLRAVPRLLRQAEANLGDSAAIPPLWVASAADQARGSLAFLADLSTGFVPQAGRAGRELRPALAGAIEGVEAFARLLRRRLAEGCGGAFPAGRDLFDFLLRRHHGLEVGADEVHAFGLRLVSEVRSRLDEAARALDGGRPWTELVGEWKRDHPAPDTLVAEYRREVERARAFVRDRDIATLPPGERLHVVETPPFQRSLTPFAAYLAPAPFEADREGYFWVTPPSSDGLPVERERFLQDHLRPGIAATTVHEAYPGHHLQLSVANLIPSKVRRHCTTPLLVEGWAFYCEEMMAELGYYGDPRSRVLQLKDELWRAYRVIIDVGLHTRGLTVDEAAATLAEGACMEPANARAEVRRYTRMPTQPLSYAVGKAAIRDLRDEVRRRQGSAFRLRAFHDRLLSYGSIPVALIRAQLLDAETPGA